MTIVLGEASADAIAAYMQQVIVEYHDFVDGHRRSEPRESIAIPVVIQACTDQFEAAGAPMNAITRDISFGGVAVFHTSRIESAILQITMESPGSRRRMKLLGKIEHQTPCGGFYIIGCRFFEPSPPAIDDSILDSDVGDGVRSFR